METVEQVFLFVQATNGIHRAEMTAATDRIPACDLSELVQWFSDPVENLAIRFDAFCLFFHPLPSGHFALGILHPCDGDERSLFKKPDSFFVRVLVIPPKTLFLKGNNPIFLYRELSREGMLPFLRKIPETLSSLTVSDKRRILDHDLLHRLAAEPGAAAVAATEQSLCDELCLFMIRPTNLSMLHLIEGLIDLLPIRFRTELSFSTELFFSENYPFRLIGLSGNKKNASHWSIATGIPLLDLDRYQKTKPTLCPTSFDAWPQFVFQILENAQFTDLERILEAEFDQLLSAPQDETFCVLDWNELHEMGDRWSKAIREGKAPDKSPASTISKCSTKEIRFHSGHPTKEILRCSSVFDRVLPLLDREMASFNLNRETVTSIILNSGNQILSTIPKDRTEAERYLQEILDHSVERLFAGERSALDEIREHWNELRQQVSWEQLDQLREIYLARIRAAVTDFSENGEEKADRNARFLDLMLLLLDRQVEINA